MGQLPAACTGQAVDSSLTSTSDALVLCHLSEQSLYG